MISHIGTINQVTLVLPATIHVATKIEVTWICAVYYYVVKTYVPRDCYTFEVGLLKMFFGILSTQEKCAVYKIQGICHDRGRYGHV